MSASTAPSEKRMEFFSAANLDDLDPSATGPEHSDVEMSFVNDDHADVFRSTSALMAPHIKASAFPFEDCGLHLGVFEFAPGLTLPLHSHPDNCIYYIERGSVMMGNRELGPGEGFRTRENLPYAFTVGADGLRLVEVTTGPRTAVKFYERNVDRWRERVEQAVEKLEVR